MIGVAVLLLFLLVIGGYVWLRDRFDRWWGTWADSHSADFDDRMMLRPPPIGWRPKDE